MLVDTHCHVNLMVKKEFDIPLNSQAFHMAETIANQAAQEGVMYILNVGTSLTESINCIHLAQKNKSMCAAVGLHPSDIKTWWKKDLKEIEKLVRNRKKNKVVGIGECGIDLYHHKENLQQQKDVFKAQIELCLTHQIPLIIHMRNAVDATYSVLDEFKNEKLTGVFHCFSADQTFADYVINLGFLIGIGGTITYPKNDKIRSIVSNISLKHIVLETDAPFLPPQIARGQQNHPKYIATIAKYIAHLKKQSFEYISEQTTHNAFDLFGLHEFQ